LAIPEGDPCWTKALRGKKHTDPGLTPCLKKPPDTVGQPSSTEIGVLNMPALKAKKLRKLPQEKVLLEL
jgi:hypothetical protein